MLQVNWGKVLEEVSKGKGVGGGLFNANSSEVYEKKEFGWKVGRWGNGQGQGASQERGGVKGPY